MVGVHIEVNALIVCLKDVRRVNCATAALMAEYVTGKHITTFYPMRLYRQDC